MKKPFRLPVKKLGFFANLKIRGKLRSLKKIEEPVSRNFFYNNRYAMSTAFLLLIGFFTADMFLFPQESSKIPTALRGAARNNGNNVMMKSRNMEIPETSEISLDEIPLGDFVGGALNSFESAGFAPNSAEMFHEKEIHHDSHSEMDLPEYEEMRKYMKNNLVDKVFNEWLENYDKKISIPETVEIKTELEEFFAENSELNEEKMTEKLKNILKNK